MYNFEKSVGSSIEVLISLLKILGTDRQTKRFMWVRVIIIIIIIFLFASYSANQILGTENYYPNYGDSPLTWCASAANGQESIEVNKVNVCIDNPAQ